MTVVCSREENIAQILGSYLGYMFGCFPGYTCHTSRQPYQVPSTLKMASQEIYILKIENAYKIQVNL